ncbi:MAG: gamma carbonic anhydrase family protein [Calditrichia bacterium]|nr:gamma carbonic anhydrase family protein [Calditrichia bacterium]
MLKRYLNKSPEIAASAYIEESALIIGDVKIGAESSVWFYSVIRGDVNYIRIGEKTNIQDGSILHVTLDKYPLHIGNNVTVGHGAILHGCNIENFSFIGMGAKILDGARIEPYSFIAAGAVVKESFVVPSGYLVAGVPAKIIRPLKNEEKEKIKISADNYVRYFKNYLATKDYITGGDCNETGEKNAKI